MQFYYGSQMPLRILDEAEVWKAQELKHIALIRDLLVNLEDKYVVSLRHWTDVLDTTHLHAKRFIESAVRNDNHLSAELHEQVLEMIAFCLQESIAFTQFCRQVKNESIAVIENHTTDVILDHIINETTHFIGRARIILYEKE